MNPIPTILCPIPGCNKAYTDIGTVFQHWVRAHSFNTRYVVIDTKEWFVSQVEARDFPKKTREELQPPPRELEVPA